MAGKFTKSITPSELEAKIAQGEAAFIVDVREDDEWESGHIEGAKHIPLGSLSQRHSELSKQEELFIVCRSGNRSGLACELLEELGYNVVNMTGGMSEWAGRMKYGK